jgi:hypothetical protein
VVESHLATYWDGDLDKGERLAAKLAASGLSWPYGMLLLVSGLYPEAEACFRHQTESRPYQPVGWEMLTESRLNLGDMAGAVLAGRQLVRPFPPDSFNSVSLCAWPLVRAGVLEEAAELIDDLSWRVARLQEGIQRRMSDRVLVRIQFELGITTGDTLLTARSIDRMVELDMRTLAGILCLRLGDDRADALLAESPQAHFDRHWWWKTSSQITPDIADHPAIERIRRELGFTPEWRFELAQRAARLPARSHISCDPAAYAC